MDATSFTFLATILILVLLSASLVLRSYILRRRYRQRFQQAYADYPLLDGGPPDLDPWERFRRCAARRGLGSKPVLWDTWMLPLDKDATWSAITPVSVHCSPSHPSVSASQSEPGPTPPVASSSPRPQPSFPSQLRITNPFSRSKARAHTTSSTEPTPPETSPPDSTCNEKDTVTLSVYVFVAMPDASTPVRLPVPDAKGKGVDLLESQAPHQGGDADPLLPSSLHRLGPRPADSVLEEHGLPLLELGLVEMKTREWVTETDSVT